MKHCDWFLKFSNTVLERFFCTLCEIPLEIIHSLEIYSMKCFLKYFLKYFLNYFPRIVLSIKLVYLRLSYKRRRLIKKGICINNNSQ